MLFPHHQIIGRGICDLIRGRILLLNFKMYTFLTGPMKEELLQIRTGEEYESSE
jgi:hypothetical protein